jgi:hypothetical protein
VSWLSDSKLGESGRWNRGRRVGEGWDRLLDVMRQRFTSANEIPVERAHIRREEWATLTQRLAAVEGELKGQRHVTIRGLLDELEEMSTAIGARVDRYHASDGQEMSIGLRVSLLAAAYDALQADLQRVRGALAGVLAILAEPGTPPKSVWSTWKGEHTAALTGPAPGEGTDHE